MGQVDLRARGWKKNTNAEGAPAPTPRTSLLDVLRDAELDRIRKDPGLCARPPGRGAFRAEGAAVSWTVPCVQHNFFWCDGVRSMQAQVNSGTPEIS